MHNSMCNKLKLDVGQAVELKDAFQRSSFGDSKWNNSDIKLLSEGDFLDGVLGLLHGDMTLTRSYRTIDSDMIPKKIKDAEISYHLKHGELIWNSIQFDVVFPRKTMIGDSYKMSDSYMLPGFLHGKIPANIVIRDYLLKNQHLISDKLSSLGDIDEISFWGTVYHSGNALILPGMSKHEDGRWAEVETNIAHGICYKPALIIKN